MLVGRKIKKELNPKVGFVLFRFKKMREHKNKNKEKNLKGVTPCKLFLHLETRTEVFCNLVY